MVFLCLIQYLNGVLVTLKLIYQIKATQRITGLIKIRAHIKFASLAPRCRLIFSKICIRLLLWSAHPVEDTRAGLRTM
jgi:hypothetical protein